MKYLCILSSARSGTNFFSSFFTHLENFKIFGEVFKPDASNELNHILQRNLFDGTNIFPVQFAHNNIGLIENLFESIQKKSDDSDVVLYKVFVEHIANDDVPNLYTPFMANQKNLHECIILYRDGLLDTFISTKLAVISNSWVNSSYGAISFQFDVDEYCSWRNWVVNMWRSSLVSLHKLNKLNILRVLSYESFVDNPLDFINGIMTDVSLGHFVLSNSDNLTIKQSNRNSIDYLLNPNVALPFKRDSLVNFVDFGLF